MICIVFEVPEQQVHVHLLLVFFFFVMLTVPNRIGAQFEFIEYKHFDFHMSILFFAFAMFTARMI